MCNKVFRCFRGRGASLALVFAVDVELDPVCNCELREDEIHYLPGLPADVNFKMFSGYIDLTPLGSSVASG